MKSDTVGNKLLWLLVGGLLAMTVFLTIRVMAAEERSPDTPHATQPKLHYQGRLLDPATGKAKADGAYPMAFAIYTAAIAGTPLWTESKDITVSQGIFSTPLGDTTPFDPAIFNGQDLWLGITVGGDPQMSPRQPLAYVPYAVFANNADQVDGHDAGDFALATHAHPVLPQAYGYVAKTEPILRDGSYNVDSAVWNASLSRYEITLTDFYFHNDDIVVATLYGDTGSCVAGATTRIGMVSGKLLVYILNSAGTKIQCSFHFVAFAGQ